MPEPLIEIPDRAAFKAAEVCEIAQIPPYVLRSWEKEFPNLGVAAKPGGPKVYRRSDIEQVLRIKQLLFSEGLTLAGVRRKLEGEPPPVEAPLELPVPEEVKEKVGRIRKELRSLLDLLGPSQQRVAPESSPGPSGASEDTGGEKRTIPDSVPGTASVPTTETGESGAATERAPAHVAAVSTWPPAPPSRPVLVEEPGLPLLDAEAETATQPPAATVPPPRKKRTKR